MEIKLLKRDDVPQAEREAHRQIQEAFHSTPFSRHWRGYAAFALARHGRGTGDDDFDLVLVTHSGIVIIELMNWNGDLLQSDGQDGIWTMRTGAILPSLLLTARRKSLRA